MLMTASSALADLYPKGRYTEYALHYKGVVLRLLSQRMSNSEDSLSDETLAALVSIKWEEVRVTMLLETIISKANTLASSLE